MKSLSSFDRKLCCGLLLLLVTFVILLSSSFTIKVNKGLTVRLSDSSFSPRELIVPPGQKVTWINAANSPNMVVSDNDFWNSGNMKSGESFSVQFSAPGIFSYHTKDQQGIIKVTG